MNSESPDHSGESYLKNAVSYSLEGELDAHPITCHGEIFISATDTKYMWFQFIGPKGCEPNTVWSKIDLLIGYLGVIPQD